MANFDFTRRLRTVSDKDLDKLKANFLDLAEQFDASTMGDHLLFPLEMTWFYGEPIWHELSEEKKLMLNRLTFCQNNYTTAVAEVCSNVLNFRASLDTIIDEDTDVALYMAREAVEETAHVQTFLTVVRKVLGYYGLTLEDLRASNQSIKLSRHYVNMHTVVGWLRGDLNFYYFTRYALNVNQKTVERCTINEPRMHPIVRQILRNHAIDEARHMQMSRGAGKVALDRMKNPIVRTVACLAYAQFASRVFLGRHKKDNRYTRESRTRLLELCGVPRERAQQAYLEWRDRVNQPEDCELVRAGRAYCLKCNHSYIDDLEIPDWLKRSMKRIVEGGYADVARPGGATSVRPLEFEDLTRAA